jgi:hypothetical protein
VTPASFPDAGNQEIPQQPSSLAESIGAKELIS